MSDDPPMQSDQEPMPDQPVSAAGRSAIIRAAILAVLVLMGGIIPFFLMSEGGGNDSLRSSQPAQDGLEAARNNTQVMRALGNRIRIDDPVVGSLTEQGSTAEVDLTIPLIGSEGEGTLYVTGTRANGEWRYSTLIVQVPGQANVITLERP